MGRFSTYICAIRLKPELPCSSTHGTYENAIAAAVVALDRSSWLRSCIGTLAANCKPCSAESKLDRVFGSQRGRYDSE